MTHKMLRDNLRNIFRSALKGVVEGSSLSYEDKIDDVKWSPFADFYDSLSDHIYNQLDELKYEVEGFADLSETYETGCALIYQFLSSYNHTNIIVNRVQR